MCSQNAGPTLQILIRFHVRVPIFGPSELWSSTHAYIFYNHVQLQNDYTRKTSSFQFINYTF